MSRAQGADQQDESGILPTEPLSMGSSFKGSSCCHRHRENANFHPCGLYYFRNWDWSREREGRGWWRGNGGEGQSVGLRLLHPPMPIPYPPPPPEPTPCTSSCPGAHRLEGRQMLTNLTDTLITARSAVSSGTGAARIPSPLRILHRHQICPLLGTRAWDPKRLTQVVRHWGNTGSPPKCLGHEAQL